MKTLTKERSDELMFGPKHVSSGHICLYKKQNKSRAIWISSKGEVSALQSRQVDANCSPSTSGMKSTANPDLLHKPLG